MLMKADRNNMTGGCMIFVKPPPPPPPLEFESIRNWRGGGGRCQGLSGPLVIRVFLISIEHNQQKHA